MIRDETRRHALRALVLFCWCSFPAAAQLYPSKPVRVVVPSQAGGGADIVARIIGQKLGETWGQQVVIDNRIGAIGPEIAAKAVPDGHTVLFTTSALAVRESLYAKLPYDTLRDFQPVTQVLSQSNVMVTHPSLPARTVRELIAYAKAKPGELNYGTGGNGTSNHLAGALFQQLASIDVVHVPYKGVPAALTDLVGGRLHYAFGSPASTLPHVKDGKLRLIAVTTPRRAAALPDVPTVAESGLPGYEFTGWMGLLVPAKAPREIVAKLHADTVRVLNTPEVRQRIVADASEPVGSSPQEFSAYLRSEVARWTQVVRRAKIKVD